MKTPYKILLGILVVFVVQLMASGMASALTIDSIDVTPNEVSPGEDVSISVEVTNNENDDITNIAGSLDIINSSFKIVDISSAFIDELRDDRSDELEFDLQALSNAKSGIYSLPLTISWDFDNKTFTRTSIVTLTVTSAPVLDVQVQDGVLIKGQNNEINLQVTNKGIADVKFLDIQIDEQGYSLLSPNNAYIGDVDSNDFQTTSFKIFIPATASNRISVPVTLTYSDVLNKEYVQSFSVDARVYSLTEAQDLGLVAKSNAPFYIGIIVLLILLYIAYRIIKRILKKRKEKEEED